MKFETYNKKERVGLILLAVLLVGSLVIWQILDKKTRPDALAAVVQAEDSLWQEFQESTFHIGESDAGARSNSESYSSGSSYTSRWKTDEELQSIGYQPKPFDPNTASIEEMIRSGVPIGSAKRIIAYRNKGGNFYKKEKLENFGFTEEEYAKVLPYISIKERNNAYPRSYQQYKKEPRESSYRREPEPEHVALNSTNAEELMRFKGIGPGYSRRILEYRDKLGGFIAKEQLKEVYGLPDSTYQHIIDRVSADPNQVRRIDVNSATEEELAAHPYIGKFMAKNIVKLRQDLGSFKNISDLRQVPLINEQKYRKIVPYIKI